MAKLSPSRIENVRLSKGQLELIAYTLRYTVMTTVATGVNPTITQNHLESVATLWARELKGHCKNFTTDRFITAVVDGAV